jgi:predicted dehydrogenase
LAVTPPLRVAVIGAGLIGTRRAREASLHAGSRVVSIVDVNEDAARRLAKEFHVLAQTDWRTIVNSDEVDVIIAATPNAFLADIANAALNAKKHVLTEKPMGRNLEEAAAMYEVAAASQHLLKVGFNHRYHPAISAAHAIVARGEIGRLINMRAQYGHGGRVGYDKEWRGNPQLAGGGELTDQGVHIVDLFHWFAGAPSEAFAYTQTAFWPIAPLEDNAFGLFKFRDGSIASLHTSWTQWKNKFLLEAFGTDGAVVVDGLGGSYGVETLTIIRRDASGGLPRKEAITFEGEDPSWKLEWDDFVRAIKTSEPYLGTPSDGLMAMRMITALYTSASDGKIARL